MGKVISIANNKGGVGKTSSVQNIGAALAKLGHQVLMIDLDPQANLTESFGFDETPISVYNVMKGDSNIPFLEIGKGFYLVPSNLDLSAAEIEFSTKAAREKILKRTIVDKVKNDFDYILIDCPPSLGLLTLNALTASDDVYVPIDAEFFSMKGIDKFSYLINQIREAELNDNIHISGVFVTMFEKVVIKREIMGMIEENFNQKLFSTKIRKNIAIAEAQLSGKSVLDYSPNSNGAKDYMNLTKEIISNGLHKKKAA